VQSEDQTSDRVGSLELRYLRDFRSSRPPLTARGPNGHTKDSSAVRRFIAKKPLRVEDNLEMLVYFEIEEAPDRQESF
jgi:hypothetical protein